MVRFQNSRLIKIYIRSLKGFYYFFITLFKFYFFIYFLLFLLPLKSLSNNFRLNNVLYVYKFTIARG